MATCNAGLGDALLRELDRRKISVWRVNEDILPELSDQQRRDLAHRLAARKALVRLERGVYVVPTRSGLAALPPLQLVGAWFRSEPHAVVGAAAAEFHGLTLDTPSTVQIQLARRKYERVQFQGKAYSFETAHRESVTSDNAEATFGSGQTSIAAPGKVVVLLLVGHRRGPSAGRDSRLAVDALEMGKRQGTWQRTRWFALVKRHGSHAAARRLGFLLEHFGIPGSDDLLPLRGDVGTVLLSPLHGDHGPLNSRWRIRVNDPLVIS